MAERSHWWTDRWLRSPLFLSLSFSFSDYLPAYLPTYLSIYLSIYLSASLKTKLFCDISSVFELDNIKNAAIQRDFLSFCTWQHQKRSNSARLPHFLHLTTSKTKQFGETSFKDGKLSAELDGLAPKHFAILRLHLSKLLRLPRKSDTGWYEVLHLSRKNTSANLKIWCSKMQPLSGNQRADFLTSLMKHVSCTAPAREKCIFAGPLQTSHARHRFWKCYKITFDKVHNPLRLPRETTSERPKVVRTSGAFNVLTSKCASRHNGVHFFNISTSKSGPELVCFVHFWLRNVLRATTPCAFSTSQLQKVFPTWSVLSFFTCKCASCHNGVHFFDIATSKSGLELVCFVHFDLEMCFAPQRRALFRHRNFQKWSGAGVFCTFWLGNVLRATTACTFSTSQLLRSWGAWYILTWTCNFSSLIWPAGSAPAALASLLFGPSGATNHWRNTVFRDFPTFSRTWKMLFFWNFLFFDLLSSSLLFSDSAHLCFSSVHIVGVESLTSKLPSTMNLEMLLIYDVKLKLMRLILNSCSAAVRRHLKQPDQRSLKDNQIWDLETPPRVEFLSWVVLNMFVPFHTHIPQPHFFLLSDQSCHCPGSCWLQQFPGLLETAKRRAQQLETGWMSYWKWLSVCLFIYLSDYLIWSNLCI